jgi:glycosyltransferase involved in cell wall biosynthesis
VSSGQGAGDATIKLLNVVTACFRGGTEGQVLNLARNLDRSRVDFQFACLHAAGDLLKDYAALGVPISEFRISNLWGAHTLMQQVRLATFMRKAGIQVMHSYNFYSNAFAIPAAKMAGLPVVIASIRDRGVYLTGAQKLVQKWVCGFADRILVNADSIKEWLLEQHYDESKITVIKNGLDLNLYSQAGSDVEFRKSLGVPRHCPLVVMISRLNPQKGIDEFIAAAAMINKSHPEVHFLVVGTRVLSENHDFVEDEEYLRQLKQRAWQLGLGSRLIFTGVRKDIPKILAEAAVSVLPSHSEGLSNTLLESMAAGVPLVATDVGGNPELVRHGRNGYLVPVMAPEALASAIVDIIADPSLAERFSNESRRIARDCHSLTGMARDTERVYLEEFRAAQRSSRRKTA